MKGGYCRRLGARFSLEEWEQGVHPVLPEMSSNVSDKLKIGIIYIRPGIRMDHKTKGFFKNILWEKCWMISILNVL